MTWWGPQLVAIAAVLVWLSLVAALVQLVRRRWPEQGEWSRKVAHIGAGPVVLIAWLLGIDPAIAVGASAGVTVLAAINHRHRVLPGIEDIDRASYGSIAYGASIGLLMLLWWARSPLTVVAGVMVMAVGDGTAGLVGPLVSSPQWRIAGQRRSLAGTAAMALASLAVLLALQGLAGAQGLPTPPLAGVAALALGATLLEQVGIGGLDNLTVPLAVAWGWHQLGGS